MGLDDIDLKGMDLDEEFARVTGGQKPAVEIKDEPAATQSQAAVQEKPENEIVTRDGEMCIRLKLTKPNLSTIDEPHEDGKKTTIIEVGNDAVYNEERLIRTIEDGLRDLHKYGEPWNEIKALRLLQQAKKEAGVPLHRKPSPAFKR